MLTRLFASRLPKVLLCVAAAWMVMPPSANCLGQEESIALWPATPPGEITATGEERDTSGADGRKVAGKPVIRLGDVSKPMLTVYPAPAEKNTGVSVVVCPGGGYHILAYDLEGSEVCEWLNSIGVTGILLKYRVPRPKNAEKPSVPQGPLMDAQRAVSLARNNAKQWNIDPNKIGILGFSAGGNLAARTATNFGSRAYDPIDATDEVSCRPDFAVLIYPAYLYREKDELVADNLPVTEKTPPMFLSMSFDDRVGPENVLRMGTALKRAGVSAEVHMFPTGGHGYGLRKSVHTATTWPSLCEAWMRGHGWLDKQ